VPFVCDFYLARREIGEGLEIAIFPQLYNVAIVRGKLSDDGWRDQW
jgi:hypothetical protein